MQDIFDARVAQAYTERIKKLTPETPAQWGRMNAAQMLAHLNVGYETIYEPQKHPKPGIIAGFFLKKFVKPKTVNEMPYRRNLPTSPMFRIDGVRDFEAEQKRLIGFIQKTRQHGRADFDGKESLSFGRLSAQEWNNLLAKHLNHHLAQFGV